MASESLTAASNVRFNDYQITTPKHSDFYPSECNEVLIIDNIISDIVSDEGIDSCNKRMKRILNLLPTFLTLLSIIKKIIALFSTAFMIDCKLFGEGHFGIQCLDQVRVITVDNSYDKKPLIHQNGKRVSIDDLNKQNECLLPLCSCIHPSTLRWNSIKYPELYERCFHDQCNNPTNICLNKPNNSKCQMRHRMCIDINDWCGNPSWYPLDFPPAKVTKQHVEVINKDSQIDIGEVKIYKYEFEINCDNGHYCCRILLGPDITKHEYEKREFEWALQWYCGKLHQEIKQFLKDNEQRPDVIYRNKQILGYVAPVYINRMDVFFKQVQLLSTSLQLYKLNYLKQNCIDEGILNECETAINSDFIQRVIDKWLNHDDGVDNLAIEGIDVESNKKIIRMVASFWTRYYHENNLCLKVLFTAQ